MATRKRNTETTREEAVNVLLAQLLRDRGLPARAERRTREGAPDVRVDLPSGDLIIIECKWEGLTGLLETQLQERLQDFPDALGAIAFSTLTDSEARRTRRPSWRPLLISHGGCRALAAQRPRRGAFGAGQ